MKKLESVSDEQISRLSFDCNQNGIVAAYSAHIPYLNKILCSKSHTHTDAEPETHSYQRSWRDESQMKHIQAHKNCQNILFLVLSSKLAHTHTLAHGAEKQCPVF